MAEEQRKISKSITKTIGRYVARMQHGEKLMRDANGKIQWASGKSVGSKSIGIMMEAGIIAPLDTDLFGDYSRGQTLGLKA